MTVRLFHGAETHSGAAPIDSWEPLRTRIRQALVGQPLPLVRVDDRACPAASLYAGGRALGNELERKGVTRGSSVAVTIADPLELTVALLAAVRLGASLLLDASAATRDRFSGSSTGAVAEIGPGDGLMPLVRALTPEPDSQTDAVQLTPPGHRQAGACWSDPAALLVSADAAISRHRLTRGMRVVAAYSLARPDLTLAMLLPALLAQIELRAALRRQLDAVVGDERPDLILGER